MTVGDRIKYRRIELGLSQEDLAKKMGYSGKSTICKAETYGDNITTNKVKKYAEALNCSYEYLMGWEDSIDYDAIVPEYNESMMIVLDSIKEISNDDALMKRLLAYIEGLNPYMEESVRQAIRDFTKK